MKYITRILVFCLSAIITLSCFPVRKMPVSEDIVVPLSDTVTKTDGTLVYALPRTVFTVTVRMERIIEKPGPYARYAGDLLGLGNAIQGESEFWSILGITVNTHEELDPSEFYVVKSNKIFLTNVLSLKREGLILDLNPAIYNPIEGKTGPYEPETDHFQSFDLGSDEYFRLQRDTAFRRVNVDSMFIRIPYIVEKRQKLTVEQMADRAARKLMEMREGKHMILTGEATVFPQSDAALKEMNRIEKEYTELFVGKTWKETKTFSYQVIPEKESVGKPIVLFMFSELTGPASNTVKGGTPVTAEFIPEHKTKDLTVINNKTDPSITKYDKLFYRVPDVVNLKIDLGNEVLFNSRRLIYQFGEIIQLPSNYIIGK
jgi:hypothetical protein